MKKIVSLITAALFPLVLFPAPAVAEIKLDTFEWSGISFDYPAGWRVQQPEGPNDETIALVLQSDTIPAVTLSINLSRDETLINPDESLAGRVGEAYCLPLALRLAGNVEEKISHLPTRIRVSGKSLPSVLMIVDREDGEGRAFSSFHCFAVSGAEHSAIGAVMSGGVRGRIMQQEPFREATEQAYDVIDSIRFK